MSMSDLRKAAEMALDALERCEYGVISNGRLKNSIETLRQALAQNDLEEAIAKGTKAWADVPNASEWVDDLRGNVDETEKRKHEWVELTEDEAKQLYENSATEWQFAQLIETKLKEKNI